MAEPNHIPFRTDCPCKECSGYRNKKQLEAENKRLMEQAAERRYGKNWKNVMCGMGDQ